MNRHHSSATAFTLVELMVAMAIGLVLLAMVVQTFRSIITAAGVIRTMSTENEALRAGLVAVLDDADFYHSEANPGLPYRKWWTRAPLTSSDPADKRHFAPVYFARSTAPTDLYRSTSPARFRLLIDTVSESETNPQVLPNPNVLLPSDPRSWLRVPPLTNTRWGMFAPQRLTQRDFPAMHPDQFPYREFPNVAAMLTTQLFGNLPLAAATDMRAMSTGAYVPLPPVPPPTDLPPPTDHPWVLWGVDYRVNQTLPSLQASVWQRLSFMGLFAYLRPNVPVICLDKDGFLPCWYDVPDTALGQSTASPLPPYYGSISAGTVYCNYLAYRDYRRTVDEFPGFENWLGLDGTPGAKTTAGTPLPPLPRYATLEAALGLTPTLLMAPIQVKPVFPDESTYLTAGGFSLVGTVKDVNDNDMPPPTRDYTTVMNRRPWSLSLGTNWNSSINNGFGNAGQVDDARSPVFASQTYRFPSNFSDAERPTLKKDKRTEVEPAQGIDLDARPVDRPVLSTSIQRRHAFLGDQITYCRVIVRVPETGRLLELPFSPVCTTYRGARQHWSSDGNPGKLPAAGDLYENPKELP